LDKCEERDAESVKEFWKISNLREEVFSQIHGVANIRFNLPAVAKAISSFYSYIEANQISTEIKDATAALFYQDASWSMESNLEENDLKVKRCNIDIDLISLRAKIDISHFHYRNTLVGTIDFLDAIFITIREFMQNKYPLQWEIMESYWMSSRVLLNKDAHMRAYWRGPSNFKLSPDRIRHTSFFPIPSLGASTDSFHIAIGIEGWKLSEDDKANIKSKIWSSAEIVSEYFDNDRYEHVNLYKESEHAVNKGASVQRHTTGGPIFCLLTALYFIHSNDIILGSGRPLKGCSHIAMETYNGKKTELKVDCNSSLVDGKIEYTADLHGKISKMLMINNILRIGLFIRNVTVLLSEKGIISGKELDFHAGLGATVDGLDEKMQPAFARWNLFKFCNDIANVRNHDHNPFTSEKDDEIPSHNVNDSQSDFEFGDNADGNMYDSPDSQSSIIFEKAYDVRFNRFPLYAVRNNIDFYFPFHAILPFDSSMTAACAKRSKYFSINMEPSSSVIKVQTYFPDAR
jgi:hypothetical protein